MNEVFMHRRIFKHFESLVSKHFHGDSVLEVGAVPNADSLLSMKCLDRVRTKVGINLSDVGRYKDFEVVRGNANDLSRYKDESFDMVLSNATLEHDPFFWKSLAEIKRVCRKGGLVVIGVPGYAGQYGPFKRLPFLPQVLKVSTLTFQLHGSPGVGDYYRFSEECVREVFLEGFVHRDICTLLHPPRIIGIGRKA